MDCFGLFLNKDINDPLINNKVSTSSSNLRVFKFLELQYATNNFHDSFKIGDGEVGDIFMGTIIASKKPPNIEVDIAVQVIKGNIVKAKTNEEWINELTAISVLQHPNVAKVLGYCIYTTENKKKVTRFIVEELAHNGSVREHLTESWHAALTWKTRLTIARDTASGLAYLHENQIIMRCFRSSIVLLDKNFDVKISYYALARLGPFPRAFMESEKLECLAHGQLKPFLGYIAPEFLNNDNLTFMKDVWCYGVFILELITGMLPFDKTRPQRERTLVNWVKPHLRDTTEFEQIIDSRLKGQYSIQTVLELAGIAELCLKEDKKLRPSMSEVLLMVSQIVQDAKFDESQC